MANDSLSIDVKFKDSQAVSGAKKVKVSLDDIKRADGSLNWDGLKKGATSAEQSQGRFSALAVTIGNLASGAITGAISKCKELAAEVVEIGSNFETSMSKVSALSGAQGEELGKLEAKARELGASTTFSASQAADALGYMALAGWDTQQMLDGVGSALTLAQAGEMDLAAASDLLTDYLSAFNMQAADAARMSDVLAYAQANANTTVEGLGMAFKNCAANANAAGMDVETTSAAIAMMANQGLKGSEAGTALNAVLRDMTAKMEDGAIAIGEQVIAVMDAEGNYRDFADILAEVEAATNGMGDAEKAAALQSTFTADSIKGLNLLLNAGAGEMSSFRDELYNCAGTAEATAKTMTDNLGGDVAAMNSAFEELALKIYEGLQEPLRDAAQFVTSTAIPALTALVQNIDKIGPPLAGAAAAIALVTAKNKLIGKDTSVWGTLRNSIEKTRGTLYKYTIVQTTAGTQLIKYNTLTKTTTTSLHANVNAAKAQASAIKASEIAMKAGSVACRALSTAMKTVAPIAVISLITELGASWAASAEQAGTLTKATEGLSASTNAYEAAAASAKGEAYAYGISLEDIGNRCLDAISKQAELSDRMTEMWSETGTNTGLVERYSQTIEDLTNKYDENGIKAQLTSEEQAKLKLAVEGLNQVCGTSYSVIDAQNGVLNTSTQEIMRNKDAWIENAKAQAIQQEMIEVQRQQIENSAALTEAKQKLAETDKGYCLQIGDTKVVQDFQNVAYEEAEQAVHDLEQTQSSLLEREKTLVDMQSQLQATMAASKDEILSTIETHQGWGTALEEAGVDTDAFAQKLSELGFKTTELNALTDEQLLALSSCYASSLEEIIAQCDAAGIEIPSRLTEAATQGAQGVTEAFVSEQPLTIEAIGGTVSQAEEQVGQLAPIMTDAATQGASGATAAIVNEQPNTSAAMAGLVEGVDTVAQGMPGAMQPYAQSGAEGVTASINNEAPNTAHAADAVRSSIDGVWNQMPGDSRNSATKSINEMASGIRASQAVAVAAADTVSKQVADHLSSAKSDARQAGKSMSGEHYKGGIEDGRGAAVSAADTASKHVADHFSSANGDAWWAGRNMASGLANGISAGRSDAVNAARAIARAAVDAAKAEAQIHSPSRVMRQIGQFFSKGLALGILDEEAQPATAAKSVMAGAISNAQAKAPAVLDIDWYARGGRVNGRTAIGIERGGSSPAPASLSQQTAARGSDADLLRELLRALLSIKSDLPHIIAANVPDSLKLNDRELGRMVRNVPR